MAPLYSTGRAHAQPAAASGRLTTFAAPGGLAARSTARHRSTTMKLGLLGSDARIAGVVAAAARRGDSVVVACDLPAGPVPFPPGVEPRREASWEAVVDPQVCDAILVGVDGWTEGRGDAVRALVQAGRTLLVSHPATLSMLWAYELDMIRGDAGGRLVPFLPDRLHPFVEKLRAEVEAGLGGAGRLGAIESIAMERRLVDRSRESVLSALARDVDLVRVIAGEPARLSTLGAADAAAASAWSTLAVGLSGPALVPVRWQVARGDEPGLEITLHHGGGTIRVEAPDDERPWRWEGAAAATPDFDRGAAMLGVLHGEPPAGEIAAATWPDAARAIELAETVPRSLAKGRAIDLHQEEFSELGTFRGTMASLGCGLVLAALLVLLVATLLGGIAREAGWELGERIAGAWPQVVLAVLGLFLALQVLPLLVDDRRPQGGRAGDDGREGSRRPDAAASTAASTRGPERKS